MLGVHAELQALLFKQAQGKHDHAYLEGGLIQAREHFPGIHREHKGGG